MKTRAFLQACLFIAAHLVLFGCSSSERVYPIAPSLLPGTSRPMKTPGFWIGRHPAPDREVLTPQQIQEFNAVIRDELKLTRDILSFPGEYSGADLAASFSKMLDDLRARGLYAADGRKAATAFFDEMRRLMSAPMPLTVKPTFGLVVRYTDQRLLPTREGLYAERFDVDFDELQNSTLDVGTPVVVLHASMDDQWFYVMSPLSDGWVERSSIGLGSKEQVAEYLRSSPRGVVVSAKADIFLDTGLTEHHEYARMGSRLPVRKAEELITEVLIPRRAPDNGLIISPAYMETRQVYPGDLPYTPRTIIRQAFELLNAPYGWGGMYGEQDCSAFLDEIFATVGIDLPRNSGDQAKVGKLLAEFVTGTAAGEKLAVIAKDAEGGTTLLTLKGHIMLYLGVVEDRAYAIHSAWAYREKTSGQDRVRLVNRVVVSDLSLGEGSSKGSHLSRIERVIGLTR